MPNKKRSSTQRASPKLFRCTGYGNCDMVFTRSEHLARHERKHTGEKPYACVVAGCDRTFSRFDNMMQHTQTHEKPKKAAPPSINKRPSIVHGHRGMRATNLASIKTEAWYDDMRSPPELSMVPSMIDSRTLPLPRRASHSGYDRPYSSSNYRPAYPYPQDHCYNIPRNRSSWPPKKEIFHPYPSHMQFNDYNYDAQRRSSTSTYSSDSNLTSPIAPNFPLSEPLVVSRRISIDNLRLPIENLSKIQLEEDYHRSYCNDKAKHIDITSDEYEALEGFSKFHSKAREDSSSPSEFTPSPIMRNQSPNMAAQVCAMRQRVMTQKESFQRR